MRPVWKVAAAVGLLVALSACGSSSADKSGGGDPTRPASLAGSAWDLTRLGSRDPMAPATLRFGQAKASGTGGCNSFSGPYRQRGSDLTIGPDLASTAMACADPVMAGEAAYFRALGRVRSFTRAKDQLVLRDGSDRTLLRFRPAATGDAALAGTWDAVSIHTGDAVESVTGTLTAEFGADGISGDGGCNRFTGQYTANGSDITIGPLASTRRACPEDDLMAQETAYLAALEAAATFRLEGDQLTLDRADGGIAVVFDRHGA